MSDTLQHTACSLLSFCTQMLQDLKLIYDVDNSVVFFYFCLCGISSTENYREVQIWPTIHPLCAFFEMLPMFVWNPSSWAINYILA